MSKPVMEIEVSPWALVLFILFVWMQSFAIVFFTKLLYGL